MDKDNNTKLYNTTSLTASKAVSVNFNATSANYGNYFAYFCVAKNKDRKIIENEKRCRNGVPKSTQTRKDIKVKVNIQSLIHPYIFSQ